jgi:hypothetical protein
MIKIEIVVKFRAHRSLDIHYAHIELSRILLKPANLMLCLQMNSVCHLSLTTLFDTMVP